MDQIIEECDNAEEVKRLVRRHPNHKLTSMAEKDGKLVVVLSPKEGGRATYGGDPLGWFDM